MHVLLMVHRLWQGGGTETHVLTLASALQKLGHRVALYTSGGPWAAHARSLGIPVRIDPSTYNAYRAKGRLRTFLKSHGIDVIHAHDLPSLWAATYAVKGLPRRHRPRVAFTVHGRYVVPRIPVGLVRGTSTKVITVSPALRKVTLRRTRLSPKRVTTVMNGIHTEIFRPLNQKAIRQRRHIPSGAFVIGYAGRFTEGKTAIGKRIVRVLARFATNNKGIYVLVAGRGSTRFMRTRPRVRVLGHVSAMQQFYNTCDIVIGTGRVAAEAASCGIPTLAIGTSGYYGLVQRKNLGHMLQTNFGDHGPVQTWSQANLARVLRRALASKTKLRTEARQVRRQLLPQFSAQSMARQVVQVYRGSL